ncbi:E3 ubiquitin-protein ligase RHA4A [Actinidia chinensis var. chinensis]|uniref:RING-type E3 ubiquitin transferase n=1 Tax=Actinidia chinensis var. chinensis TaxID=1590841 RepID=A0A2R6PHS4_ACTCC|nr:E3 ubiquitin-protein ligase RHA4A [Actinidia chinensis var. chinensis]
MSTSYAQAPTSPHLYSQSLQLKLYQAFIFSIPILFSIILFLLFYLFYLKRRAPTDSFLQPALPTSLHEVPFAPSSRMGLKGNLKDKLPTILFNEVLRTRDSMLGLFFSLRFKYQGNGNMSLIDSIERCCVCLGEFEIEEELHQIPTCRHVFHIDCIRYWVDSNPTCPLCRCFILPRHVHSQSRTPLGPNPVTPQMLSPQQQQQQQQQLVRVNNNEHMVVLMEGSSGDSANPHQDSVVLNVQTHNG